MASIADDLTLLPFFSRVARADIDRAARYFRRAQLAPNEMLWSQGAVVDELAIVLVGELVAHSQLQEVGRVRAPDIVGEAGAFVAGSTRSATLKAACATELLALAVPDLRALRFAKSRVYDAILEQAQRSACRRIAATNANVARVAAGGRTAPARREPSSLVRLWRTLRPGGPSGPCPPVGPLLRSQPGLRDMDPDLEELLAVGFSPESFEEGQVIVLEGESGSAMYLVADGQIDVLRNVRGDRAELLVRLGPGQQLGANTLVDPAPRTASCVAATAGWLYRMDRQAFDGLRGDARTAWRESILATLATQIRYANNALERALGGSLSPTRVAPDAPRGAARGVSAPPSGTADFAELIRASGFLESLPAGEAELEEVSFSMDDDTARRRTNKNSPR